MALIADAAPACEEPVPDDFDHDSVEIVEAQWFPKDALPSMQRETAEALRRVF